MPVDALLPPCPFHAATGLLCPGCGSTRALLALAHGHLHAAWQLNPLLLLLLPLAAAYLLLSLHRRALVPVPRPATAALLAVTLLFAVARNL